MTPDRSYLVCATPRSGSTLVCHALGETGVAGRPEEYYEALRHSGRPRHPEEYFLGVEDQSIRDHLGERSHVIDYLRGEGWKVGGTPRANLFVSHGLQIPTPDNDDPLGEIIYVSGPLGS